MSKTDLSTIKERTPKKRNTQKAIEDPKAKAKAKKESSFKPEMKTSQFEDKTNVKKISKEEGSEKTFTLINNKQMHKVTTQNFSSSNNFLLTLGAFVKVILELKVREDGTLMIEKNGKEIEVINKTLKEEIMKTLNVAKTQANNLIKEMINYSFLEKPEQKDKKGNPVIDEKTGKPKLDKIYIVNPNFVTRGPFNQNLGDITKLYDDEIKEIFKQLKHKAIGILAALIPFFNHQTCFATEIADAKKDLISEEETIKETSEKFLKEHGFKSLKAMMANKTEEEILALLENYAKIRNATFYKLFKRKFVEFTFLNESQLAERIGLDNDTLSTQALELVTHKILLIISGPDGNRYIMNPEFLSKFHNNGKLPAMDSYLSFLKSLFENDGEFEKI